MPPCSFGENYQNEKNMDNDLPVNRNHGGFRTDETG
jgi:hypothetical protein